MSNVQVIDGGDHGLPVAIRQRRINCALLNHVDIRLVEWGKWARSQSDYLGYPKLSLIYKVLRRHAKRLGRLARPLELRLKGLTARGAETRSLRPRTIGEVSAEIQEVDRAVASVASEERQVIRIEYLMPEQPLEVKAALMNCYPSAYGPVLKRAKLAVGRRLSIA